MTSRPVRLFIAESGIPCVEQVVDLMTGEHLKEAYASLNPNKLVPMLEDGDMRLTESSAILKYLAEKTGSPAYPKDLKARAKVNEIMVWFNTNFYRDFGYGMAYPQLFPHHKRADDTTHAGTIAWGQERSKAWLQVLNDHWLAGGKEYICGEQITIADYLGAGFVSLGEIIRMDFGNYPNIKRWLGNMKKLKSWPSVNEVFYGFAGMVKDQPFVTLQ
jgi:glutathione S-transferase